MASSEVSEVTECFTTTFVDDVADGENDGDCSEEDELHVVQEDEDDEDEGARIGGGGRRGTRGGVLFSAINANDVEGDEIIVQAPGEEVSK
jgi:hypothetical protein